MTSVAMFAARTYLRLPWRPLVLIDGVTVYEQNEDFQESGRAFMVFTYDVVPLHPCPHLLIWCLLTWPEDLLLLKTSMGITTQRIQRDSTSMGKLPKQ
ncbi:hypothetical protein LINPERPRIM_LOCUS31419, partial [Linum perenne]